MTPYIQVEVSAANPEEAERLAQALIEARLAACVQLSPCHSRYHWQGQIEASSEMRCAVKSRRDLFPELCALIRSLHSYQTPEIIALPMVEADAAYLSWMEQELRPQRKEEQP